MSLGQRHLPAGPVWAALALALVIAFAVGGSAFAQRRPALSAAQPDRTPACFDRCFNGCLSSGSSGGSCSRTCYARCSGVTGDTENRH
jgi:hypothetical protein